MRHPGECRVLILEDEILIALDLEQKLRDAGYRHITNVATIADAMECIGTWQPDLAVVDLNVNGQKSFPVADALDTAGVPFVVVSGHNRHILPEHHAARPFLAKPYDPAVLLRTLQQLTEAADGRERRSESGQ